MPRNAKRNHKVYHYKHYTIAEIADSVCGYLEAVETIPKNMLTSLLETKQGCTKRARPIIQYMLKKGFCVSNLKEEGKDNEYLLLRSDCEVKPLSQAVFRFFYEKSKSIVDLIDKSRYPNSHQMYINNRIYTVIHLDEGGLQKLKYRYSLPEAISNDADIIPVLMSTGDHQQNLSILRENPDLIPQQPYIFARAFYNSDGCKIICDEYEGGQKP